MTKKMNIFVTRKEKKNKKSIKMKEATFGQALNSLMQLQNHQKFFLALIQFCIILLLASFN
jgi:hypothetical protein